MLGAVPLLLFVVWRTLGTGWRQTVTLLSLAVGFLMLSLFLAISFSFWERFSVAPEEIAVVASTAQFVGLPLVLAQQLAGRDDVEDVAYDIGLPVSRGDRFFWVDGVGASSGPIFAAMGLEVAPALEAALRGNRIGALVGADLAAALDVGVGDALVVESNVPRRDGTRQWEFAVVGIFEARELLTGDRVFANYDYMDASVAEEHDGEVRQLFLRMAPGADVGQVASDIDERSRNSAYPLNTLPMKAWLAADNRPIGDVLTLASVVSVFVAGIALLVQGSATAQDVARRGPMLSVLLLYGHSWLTVWACAASITLLYSLAAAAAGFALAYQLFPILSQVLAAKANFPLQLLPAIGGGAALFAVCVTAIPIAAGLRAPLARSLAGLGR